MQLLRVLVVQYWRVKRRIMLYFGMADLKPFAVTVGGTFFVSVDESVNVAKCTPILDPFGEPFINPVDITHTQADTGSTRRRLRRLLP